MTSLLSYITLFLPLIASVFCFLLNFKKGDFLVFITTIFLLLVLVVKLSFDFAAGGEIAVDNNLGVLSIATEYRLDSLTMFFLATFLLLKILLAFFYREDFCNHLNAINGKSFYATWLLNIFAIIGIITTNNIFNLFIFVEVYCLTFCAIMTISGDSTIAKLAFRYFCNSALASILLLVGLFLIYFYSDSLKINNINQFLFLTELSGDEIKQLTGQLKLGLVKSLDLRFWQINLLILAAIWIKFLPIGLYCQMLKSKNLLSNFLLTFSLICNGLIGFYLLFRVLEMLNFNQIIVSFLFALGLVLVFYSNYKMLKIKHLKVFAVHFLLLNLGFIFITFLFDHSFGSNLFYIVNYTFGGLFILVLSRYININYQSCNFALFENVASKSLVQGNFFLKKNIAVIALIVILFISPAAAIFWANWYLSLLVFDYNFEILVLIPIIITNLVFAYIITDLIYQKSFQNL